MRKKNAQILYSLMKIGIIINHLRVSIKLYLRQLKAIPTKKPEVWYEYRPLLTEMSLVAVQQRRVPGGFTRRKLKI